MIFRYVPDSIVDQFEEYFVFGQRCQWLDEVSRIEGDGLSLALVIDRRFSRASPTSGEFAVMERLLRPMASLTELALSLVMIWAR